MIDLSSQDISKSFNQTEDLVEITKEHEKDFTTNSKESIK